MTTAIPKSIRALFNTFPLVTLPALTDVRTSSSPEMKVPTLYLCENDPSCISAQILLHSRSIDYATRVVPKDANETLPFLVVSRAQAKDSPGFVDEKVDLYDGRGLYNYIEQKSSKVSISENEKAFTNLVTDIMASTWTLACYIDILSEKSSFANLLTDYRIRKHPANIITILDDYHTWDDLVYEFRIATDALATKLSHMGADSFTDLFDSVLFGYLHCIMRIEQEDTRKYSVKQIIKKNATLLSWYQDHASAYTFEFK